MRFFDRLSCGLSAVRLMTLGLDGMRNTQADGFYAVCRYLDEAEGEMRRLLESVSTPVTTA